MQVADAEIRGRGIGELLKRPAMITAHPTAGSRAEYDDLVNVIEKLVAPAGQQPSRWVGQEMLDILTLFKSRSLFATGDASGVAFELPWADYSCLVELNPTFKHPRIGNCLHVTMKLSDAASHEQMVRIATVLNAVEALPGTATD